MYIGSVKCISNKCFTAYPNAKNIADSGKKTCYDYKNKSYQQINFTAIPWYIPYLEINDAYDAIALYDYFKVGNYLDSSDDDVSYDSKVIRKNNLAFLDALKSAKDKKQFIENYKNITGFPNLKKVSENIEREFIVGIKKSSIGLEGGECIAAGYDDSCSVGKRRAFPGSDLDKAFVVIKGSSPFDKEKDKLIVQEFKNRLWNNVDQRILSFNHDISFPSIYTSNQIINLVGIIDYKIRELPINKEYLEDLINNEYLNLEKASAFNIAVNQKFPVNKQSNEITKEDVKNFGYFIESLRDGKYLITSFNADILREQIEDSKFFKYSNLAQIRAVKNAVLSGRENKNKIKLRENMASKFESWNIDKQYDFIKSMIKYSCEDQDDFKEYFTNDRNVKEAYKPLLNIVTRGDRNIYYRVEFSKERDKLTMTYAKDRSVDLYKGYSDNILWIDGNDTEAIKQVFRNINKIRQCELFNNIYFIQCPKPNGYIDGFYPINFKTNDGTIIYERSLK